MLFLFGTASRDFIIVPSVRSAQQATKAGLDRNKMGLELSFFLVEMEKEVQR